jgi:hypothetical protein
VNAPDGDGCREEEADGLLAAVSGDKVIEPVSMCRRWLTMPVRVNPITGVTEEYHSEVLKDDLPEEEAAEEHVTAIIGDDY